MNWYKTALTITKDTRMDTIINLSVRELLAIDSFVDKGINERTAKEILLRIIRENSSIIRMHSEGKL